MQTVPVIYGSWNVTVNKCSESHCRVFHVLRTWLSRLIKHCNNLNDAIEQMHGQRLDQDRNRHRTCQNQQQDKVKKFVMKSESRVTGNS